MNHHKTRPWVAVGLCTTELCENSVARAQTWWAQRIDVRELGEQPEAP